MPITYTDKELYIDRPEIPTEKKFRYQDANEVKNVVNTHIADVANPHAVTKSQVGLSNADNTSDVNKPVSTATQTALDLKQNISAWTDWSASLATVGFSSTTVLTAYYRDNGATVDFWLHISGTSNSASFTFALPFALNAAYATNGLTIPVWIINNNVAAFGFVAGSGSSATITVYREVTGVSAWTASGVKLIRAHFSYMK